MNATRFINSEDGHCLPRGPESHRFGPVASGCPKAVASNVVFAAELSTSFSAEALAIRLGALCCDNSCGFLD